jgi:hypothetical protein
MSCLCLLELVVITFECKRKFYELDFTIFPPKFQRRISEESDVPDIVIGKINSMKNSILFLP